MHHGQWRLSPPRLGSVHGETLWGGYFRGTGASAPVFRAPDVHLRLWVREGGLGARRRTDKRAGAPAFGAGSSGPGEGTESRRRGQTTSECASAKVFLTTLERSPDSTRRSNTFRGRRGDQIRSNAPSPPVSGALPNLMTSWGGGTSRTHRGQVADRDDHHRAGSDIRGSPASEKGGGTSSQDAPARCIMADGLCIHLVSVPFTMKLSGGAISEVRGPARLFSGHRTSTSDLRFGRGGWEREGGRETGREHRRSTRDRRGLGRGQRAGGEVGR